jgi:hypothetical protein
VTASHRVDRFSKNDVIVSPSILSANFAKLGEQVRHPTRRTVLTPCMRSENAAVRFNCGSRLSCVALHKPPAAASPPT